MTHQNPAALFDYERYDPAEPDNHILFFFDVQQRTLHSMFAPELEQGQARVTVLADLRYIRVDIHCSEKKLLERIDQYSAYAAIVTMDNPVASAVLALNEANHHRKEH